MPSSNSNSNSNTPTPAPDAAAAPPRFTGSSGVIAGLECSATVEHVTTSTTPPTVVKAPHPEQMTSLTTEFNPQPDHPTTPLFKLPPGLPIPPNYPLLSSPSITSSTPETDKISPPSDPIFSTSDTSAVNAKKGEPKSEKGRGERDGEGMGVIENGKKDVGVVVGGNSGGDKERGGGEVTQGKVDEEYWEGVIGKGGKVVTHRLISLPSNLATSKSTSACSPRSVAYKQPVSGGDPTPSTPLARRRGSSFASNGTGSPSWFAPLQVLSEEPPKATVVLPEHWVGGGFAMPQRILFEETLYEVVETGGDGSCLISSVLHALHAQGHSAGQEAPAAGQPARTAENRRVRDDLRLSILDGDLDLEIDVEPEDIVDLVNALGQVNRLNRLDGFLGAEAGYAISAFFRISLRILVPDDTSSGYFTMNTTHSSLLGVDVPDILVITNLRDHYKSVVLMKQEVGSSVVLASALPFEQACHRPVAMSHMDAMSRSGMLSSPSSPSEPIDFATGKHCAKTSLHPAKGGIEKHIASQGLSRQRRSIGLNDLSGGFETLKNALQAFDEYERTVTIYGRKGRSAGSEYPSHWLQLGPLGWIALQRALQDRSITATTISRHQQIAWEVTAYLSAPKAERLPDHQKIASYRGNSLAGTSIYPPFSLAGSTLDASNFLYSSAAQHCINTLAGRMVAEYTIFSAQPSRSKADTILERLISRRSSLPAPPRLILLAADSTPTMTSDVTSLRLSPIPISITHIRLHTLRRPGDTRSTISLSPLMGPGTREDQAVVALLSSQIQCSDLSGMGKKTKAKKAARKRARTSSSSGGETTAIIAGTVPSGRGLTPIAEAGKGGDKGPAKKKAKGKKGTKGT